MCQQSKSFVLVHGAFFGGWVWQKVAKRLLAKGARVSSPTLTGVGERAHLRSAAVDLSTHVQDLVAHLEMEDVRDATLVGWSYGGMVVNDSLNRIAARIKSVIYLDAFVPEKGRSVYDHNTAEARARMDRNRLDDRALVPYPLDFFDITDEHDRAWMTERQTPQPWRTMFEPAKIAPTDFPGVQSYVRCTHFLSRPFDDAQKRTSKRGYRQAKLNAGHLCMVTAPEITADCLLSLSAAV